MGVVYRFYINPTIVPAKILSNRTHKLRIALSHNGETRYIVTDIIVQSLSEFKSGQIIKRPDAQYLNTKLRKISGIISGNGRNGTK